MRAPRMKTMKALRIAFELVCDQRQNRLNAQQAQMRDLGGAAGRPRRKPLAFALQPGEKPLYVGAGPSSLSQSS